MSLGSSSTRPDPERRTQFLQLPDGAWFRFLTEAGEYDADRPGDYLIIRYEVVRADGKAAPETVWFNTLVEMIDSRPIEFDGPLPPDEHRLLRLFDRRQPLEPVAAHLVEIDFVRALHWRPRHRFQNAVVGLRQLGVLSPAESLPGKSPVLQLTGRGLDFGSRRRILTRFILPR